MLETLKAQIETELTLACPDRRRTRRLASLLVGAMLDEDVSEGPGRSRLQRRLGERGDRTGHQVFLASFHWM